MQPRRWTALRPSTWLTWPIASLVSDDEPTRGGANVWSAAVDERPSSSWTEFEQPIQTRICSSVRIWLVPCGLNRVAADWWFGRDVPEEPLLRMKHGFCRGVIRVSVPVLGHELRWSRLLASLENPVERCAAIEADVVRHREDRLVGRCGIEQAGSCLVNSIAVDEIKKRHAKVVV